MGPRGVRGAQGQPLDAALGADDEIGSFVEVRYLRQGSGGMIFAVAVMWARASWTVQGVLSEATCQLSSSMPAQDLPAGQIAAAFVLTKPTISQHLAVLREAGLVTMTARGTSRRYRARQEALTGLRGALHGAARGGQPVALFSEGVS